MNAVKYTTACAVVLFGACFSSVLAAPGEHLVGVGHRAEEAGRRVALAALRIPDFGSV